MEAFWSFIDKLDYAYWLILIIVLFGALVMLYIFYMIRSKKELEYLQYEINETKREQELYKKMREDMRRF